MIHITLEEAQKVADVHLLPVEGVLLQWDPS